MQVNDHEEDTKPECKQVRVDGDVILWYYWWPDEAIYERLCGFCGDSMGTSYTPTFNRESPRWMNRHVFRFLGTVSAPICRKRLKHNLENRCLCRAAHLVAQRMQSSPLQPNLLDVLPLEHKTLLLSWLKLPNEEGGDIQTAPLER
jgi:hypothetical protein